VSTGEPHTSWKMPVCQSPWTVALPGCYYFLMTKEDPPGLDSELIPQNLRESFERILQSTDQRFQVPPPVFEAMRGRLISYEPEEKVLRATFPVLPEQLNPYGSMQGGMVAAAIDNTLGPLSMLIAPANFTRHLEVKYRRSITPEIGHVVVEGRFVEQKKRQLLFQARVLDGEGKELATAKAVHWIVDDEQLP
jgi:uncharacterized protein (TIGR00369 family)